MISPPREALAPGLWAYEIRNSVLSLDKALSRATRGRNVILFQP